MPFDPIEAIKEQEKTVKDLSNKIRTGQKNGERDKVFAGFKEAIDNGEEFLQMVVGKLNQGKSRLLILLPPGRNSPEDLTGRYMAMKDVPPDLLKSRIFKKQ